MPNWPTEKFTVHRWSITFKEILRLLRTVGRVLVLEGTQKSVERSEEVLLQQNSALGEG
jgi:hypothetical protein